MNLVRGTTRRINLCPEMVLSQVPKSGPGAPIFGGRSGIPRPGPPAERSAWCVLVRIHREARRGTNRGIAGPGRSGIPRPGPPAGFCLPRGSFRVADHTLATGSMKSLVSSNRRDTYSEFSGSAIIRATSIWSSIRCPSHLGHVSSSVWYACFGRPLTSRWNAIRMTYS